MGYRDSDPSQNGNSSVLTRGRVASALLAFALLASGSADNTRPTSPARDPSAFTTPEISQEALRGKVQATAIGFASKIVEQFQRGDTKDRDGWVTEDSDRRGLFTVHLVTRAGAINGGDYGEYAVSARMRKNGHGDLDPTTTTWISIDMDAKSNTGENSNGSRGGLYSFAIFDYAGHDDWRVGRFVTHPDGNRYANLYTTRPVQVRSDAILQPLNSDSYPFLWPLTSDLASQVVSQANIVYQWSVQGTPVDYASKAAA